MPDERGCRRTGDLLVRPLEFSGVRRYLPRRCSFEKCVAVYAILGGMPGYLRQFDPSADLEHSTSAK